MTSLVDAVAAASEAEATWAWLFGVDCLENSGFASFGYGVERKEEYGVFAGWHVRAVGVAGGRDGQILPCLTRPIQ